MQSNSSKHLTLAALLSMGLGCATAFGGSALFTLDTAPTNGPTASDFWLTGAGGAGPAGGSPGTWSSSLGASSLTNKLFTPMIGQTNSGFIQLTTGTGQTAAVLFPDFDKGLVVAGFDFKCMIKMGDWTSTDPADGFSVNYIRAEDPILAVIESGTDPGRGGDATTPGWAGTTAEGGGEYNLPEEGAKTGISVGFDTWGISCGPVQNTPNAQPFGGANGSTDVRGLDVRVDGVLVTNICMPNVIPWGNTNTYDYTTDATSMMTGPVDDANPGDGALLNWVPLEVKVDTNGVLNVWWKGSNVVANLQTTYYPSPGRIVFGASTGGADEFAGVDNIAITTYPSSIAIFSGASADYSGYTFRFADSGTSVVDTNTIQIKIDGTNVPSSAITSVTKDTNGITTVMITTFPPTLQVSGSTHTVDATFKDTAGDSLGRTGVKVTVKPYVFIPSSYALDPSTVKTNLPGFFVKVAQSALKNLANSNERSEQQLFGELGPNTADVSTFTDNGYLDEANVINYPSGSVPGIDNGTAPKTTDFSMAFYTVLHFPAAGSYSLGVNSDDGFRTYVGTNELDRFQEGSIIVGEYDGGRGRADTIYNFIITQPGYYAFRTTYEQGGGGYGVNWFSVLPDGVTKVDLNDSSGTVSTNFMPAYRQIVQQRAYIKSITPGEGFGVYNTTGGVQIVVQDANTKYVSGSAKLQFDGQDVTSKLNVTGASGTTTVAYNPGPLEYFSQHSVTFSYGETGTPTNTTRTVDFSFIVRTATPSDLATNSFWIEAEDWDFGGGHTTNVASVMPYGGGAYANTGTDTSKFNIDYHNDDHGLGNATSGDNEDEAYRSGGDLDVKDANGNNIQSVDTTSNSGGQFGIERPGGFTLAADWRIGWINGGDWGNYTRTIPANIYTAYAAMSHGDGQGTPNDLRGSLAVVTSGWGTTSQSTTTLGTFDGPSSGAWGDNFLVPMLAPDGSPAVFKMGGTNTLRFNADNGDFDWFVLVPTTSPAKVVNAAPGAEGAGTPMTGYGRGVPRNLPIAVTIANLSTKVVTSTIKLTVNGADMTSSASVTTSTDGNSVYVHAPAPGGDWPVGTNTYTLTYSDDASPAHNISFTSTFLVDPRGTPGQFLIEAEDFDFGGGQTTNVASVMPYLGGSYTNLSAIWGVDYSNNDSQDSENYRVGGDLHVAGKGSNMDPGPGDFDRGSWTNTVNYKIGWIDSADWFNYTRTFPTNNYQVWVALSHGDAAGTPHRLIGSVGLVTSGVGTTNQTVQVLGSCDAPSSGTWGLNNLVQMTDTNGTPIVVPLGGTETVQFQGNSGDYDYLLFVPGTAPVKFSNVQVSGGNLIITWNGGGTLQQATTSAGPWSPVTGNPASPATVPVGSNKTLFFRISK